MKRKLSTISTILVIGFIIYFIVIRPEYKWADKIIDIKSRDNWVLITKTESWALMRPWTWFKSTVTRLSFAKKGDIARIDSVNIVGHVYNINYFDEETKGSEFYEVFNCFDHKSTIIKNPADFKTFDPNKADWRKVDMSTPSIEIFDYYCSKNKKYTMLGLFGESVDISNYIISEMYSLIDSSKYIYEIKNNNPYTPNKNDEKILRNAISKWLNEKYPNQIFNIPTNIYSKSKYKISKMGYFNVIDDIYSVEIIPNSNIGKIDIEFDFTRQSIPDQYREFDEVRILENE